MKSGNTQSNLSSITLQMGAVIMASLFIRYRSKNLTICTAVG